MATVKITITLDEALLKQIDKQRGMVPRSTYIASKLQELTKK